MEGGEVMEGGGVREWDSGRGGRGREESGRGEGVRCTHHLWVHIICGHIIRKKTEK